MKQNITISQLEELSKEKQIALREWYWSVRPWKKPKDEVIQIWEKGERLWMPEEKEINIGLMIEFLATTRLFIKDTYIDDNYKYQIDGTGVVIGWSSEEICDSLWENVKKMLELSE